MSDTASHSLSGLQPEDRQLPQQDLYLKIATQLRHFFKYEFQNLPLEIAGKILQVEVQIPNLEPLSWLAKQSIDVKTYWADRTGNLKIAGVGIADLVTDDRSIDRSQIFNQLRQNLSPLFPQIRYYGGIDFSQDRPRSLAWKLFGNYRFVVPRFEIRSNGIDTYFTCNFRCKSLTDSLAKIQTQLDLLEELSQLNLTIPNEAVKPVLPLVIDRTDSPTYRKWQQSIESGLSKFAELNIDKIVLARQTTLTFTEDLQPQSLLLALQPHNPHSYHFCFQIEPHRAFIGTSPERLYHRRDRILATEAIAGTRHRGESSQIDRQLSDNLRKSAKDLREHQLVVDNLRAILADLCDRMEIDRELTILKLNKVQHLYTQCRGILKAEIDDDRILPQLHPTPAVGGFPRPQALELIHQLEPFERGWYAAPVGWVGYNETEFAVAIRSGLVDRDRLLLFAGAGIVSGSQAEEEWVEVENKIRHFTDLFTARAEVSGISGTSNREL
jgi:menaquinone-specific isochorismate synthase